MKFYRKLLVIGSTNLAFIIIGITALELSYGKWFKTKPFVPNILPREGISHDLSMLGQDWGVTTRVPDENGAVRYSVNSGISDHSNKCNVLVLGGSTAEERILNKKDTWTYRLFHDLNKRKEVMNICPLGLSLTNAAVNGHSIVANYFDVVYWISRFKQSYSTAIIYQGINDFQGDILEEMDWYDLYWQHITYGLRYNSVLIRLVDSLRNSRFKWEGWGRSNRARDVVLVTPYQRDMSEWRTYRVDPKVYKRLSIGVDHHGKYVKLLTERLKKLGVSHIIWITQTKPFCKLYNMPQSLDVRGSHTSQKQFDGLVTKEQDELKSWIAHDRLGDCLRLGLIRSSYLNSSVKLRNRSITSTVVDYGSSTESNTGSYDDHHKNPSGSLVLWKQFDRMGLPESIINHISQLRTK